MLSLRSILVAPPVQSFNDATKMLRKLSMTFFVTNC